MDQVQKAVIYRKTNGKDKLDTPHNLIFSLLTAVSDASKHFIPIYKENGLKLKISDVTILLFAILDRYGWTIEDVLNERIEK